MQITALQKSTAQAIVNIFETGSILGDYSSCICVPGDAGQLTYGRSQTTLASGNLYLLVEAYCARTDGAYSAQLKPYLSRLQACDSSLNNDMTLRATLTDAGKDPVMQAVQDQFFDEVYWDPAMKSADAIGVKTPLGAAVVYDSTVHGSWAHVRDLTRQQFGELTAIGEQKWISDYVDTRRNWLATYPNPLLHVCVYRMDAFRAIITAANWNLGLAINVRGNAITPDSLVNNTPVSVPAEGTPRRVLRLATPPMTGPDVTWLQQRLTQAGINVAESGTFDQATDQAVRAFQQAHDLSVDGVVGNATRQALEDIPVLQPKQATTAAATAPMPAVAQPKVAPAPAATTPAPATGAPATSAPAATTDSTTDIKKHVTTQVTQGVAAVQKTVLDTHQQVVQLVTPAAKKAQAPAITPDMLNKARDAAAAVKLTSSPMLAAILSAAMALLADLRDEISWVQAGLDKAGLKGVQVPNFPNLPQSPGDAVRFAGGVYAYLHTIAASLPNEWVFRFRIAGALLILYAIYRLRAAHVNLAKIQAAIDNAHGDVTQVESDVTQARQDVSEVVQVAKDVENVAKNV